LERGDKPDHIQMTALQLGAQGRQGGGAEKNIPSGISFSKI